MPATRPPSAALAVTLAVTLAGVLALAPAPARAQNPAADFRRFDVTQSGELTGTEIARCGCQAAAPGRSVITLDEYLRWRVAGGRAAAPAPPPRAEPAAPAPVPAAAAAAAAAPPPAAAGRPLGLYLNAVTIVGFGTTYEHYYFWPDGRVCHFLPSGGVDAGLTYEAAARQAPNRCGRSAVRGGRLQIAFEQNPRPFDVSFRRSPDGNFEINLFPAVRVRSYAPGQRLNGTWAGTITGGQMRRHTLTLRADGTFAVDDQPVTSRDGPPRQEAGTYRLAGNTLELTSAAGTQRRTVYPFPDEHGSLMVDGTVLSGDPAVRRIWGRR